jgi:hypothetical protein
MKTFLDEIDELVASVRTATTPEERIEYLKKALNKVCLFLTRLNRKMDSFINETLGASAIGTEGVAIRVKDFVAKHEEFEIFQNKAQLREFLIGMRPVLIQQRYFNEKRINEIIGETIAVYDQMMEEAVSVEDFGEKFQMLERFFCRPPEGPLGGSKHGHDDDSGGGGGASETRSQMICRYIQTVAALLQIFQPLITGAPSAQDTQILQLRLFALIRISTFATQLGNNEIIPVQVEVEAEKEYA